MRYIKVTLETNEDLLAFEADLDNDSLLFPYFNASSCICSAEEVEELEAEDGIGEVSILLGAEECEWDHLLFTVAYLKGCSYDGMTIEFM